MRESRDEISDRLETRKLGFGFRVVEFDLCF